MVLSHKDMTSDGEAPAKEIWRMRRTPLLALLPAPLEPVMVVLDRVLCVI